MKPGRFMTTRRGATGARFTRNGTAATEDCDNWYFRRARPLGRNGRRRHRSSRGGQLHGCLGTGACNCASAAG